MARVHANDQPQGFSNRIEKVAIVGAGGHMGKHIAEALLKTGKHIVTAIARPSSTSKLPEGVHVARIDYCGDDDTALIEALQGQQVLIITMAVGAPSDTVPKLVRGAAKAGVPYVLPNWFGHDANNDTLCDDSLLSRYRDNISAEIESLGVSSYLMLVCNFWYEFSLGGGPDRYGFDFKKRSLVWFDDGNVAINTSTWPQCGRAIANLLSLKQFPDNETDRSPSLSQFRNGSIYISSFRLSQRDMFESVKRVTDTTDADWIITHESAEQPVFFGNGGGDYQSTRGLHSELLGLTVEDLDEFTAVGIRMGENGEVVQAH